MSAGVSETFSELYSHAKSSGLRLGMPMTLSLIHIYNRRYYEDVIKSRSEPAGVAVLDLDDFKLYNDTYGQDVYKRQA